jgi:excinuclease ABC subunit A
MPDPTTHIVVQGAREHNLQGVDVALPRDALTVITGLSGSGKSSLAFDTLYQEGQRRYLESLSAYARQFLGKMEKPLVERVDGLSPTLAIDQKGINRNPRSTVGTVTEILDHLRLWMARLGTPHCPVCDRPIHRSTPGQLVDHLLTTHPGTQAVVMGPVVRERKGEYRRELSDLLAQGYTRARIDGTLQRLDEPTELARYEKHSIEVVVDRLAIHPDQRERLLEALENGLGMGQGVVTLLIDDAHHTFATELGCPEHSIFLPELEPRLFSFNTPQGACPECEGLGWLEAFDPALVIDPEAPTVDACLAMRNGHMPFVTTVDQGVLRGVLGQLHADPDRPWRDQPPAIQQAMLHGAQLEYEVIKTGSGRPKQVTRTWKGLLHILDRIWHFTHHTPLEAFRTRSPCRSCAGTRLNPIARAVRFGDRALPQLVAMSVGQARAFFDGIELSERQRPLGDPILRELRHRLRFLDDVGLGYLTLDRRTASLSGGEAQRIRLAAQVGSGLQGVTYILDEPSIGLHPRDNRRLLDTLLALRNRGNTVLVVEHDAETMRAADHLIEIGPGAGRAGGHITAQGSWDEFSRSDGLTASFLQGRSSIPVPRRRRPGSGQRLVVRGATAHNLRDIDVAFPLGCLVAVTGVSGSGKSTLLLEILEPAAARALQGAQRSPLAHRAIEGLELLDKVVCIDQDPIGRTPRSNPATYTGALTGIRQLFARLPESQARGYEPGRFSFNVPGGRCEACQGAGVQVLEMQFLADVHVPCEDCGGKRFNAETLEIRFRGRTITDVLAMTVTDALAFFRHHRSIARPLATLEQVGLGYVALGQPSSTLSGGEAQRIKLARELQRPPTGRTLYLLDEPTTGLHFADIQRLVDALQALVSAGNTVVVIEHNTDVIKVADHIIDMGPDGGDGGGLVVGQGTPEHIAGLPTPTGLALAALPELSGQPLALAAQPHATYSAPTPQRHDIAVRGARRHNLQGIDVTIPKGSMTVITGVSGSGKSSLALHTLFSEGQRRYVESLSTYARRFLGRLDRAPVDSIEGLAPSIAIEQRKAAHNPRSTVATVTEIYDLLRLLWARIGQPHCHLCGRPVLGFDPASAARWLAEQAPGRGRLITQLQPAKRARERQRELQREGFARLWDGGADVPIDSPQATGLLRAGAWLVLDRIDPSDAPADRVSEAVRSAYGYGRDRAVFQPVDGPALPLSLRAECPEHGPVLPEQPGPRDFSFNSHVGACPRCDGLGEVKHPDSQAAVCPACDGQRLKAPILGVHIAGLNIAQLCALTVQQAQAWVEGLTLSPREQQIVAQLLPEVVARLGFLRDVGLGYLTLDRRGHSLSGGEAQRIRLASQLGSRLTGTLYVLDEPTIGLHARDVGRLLDTLEGLRDLGNTVVLVEHDLATIRRSDWVIDLGPGAGAAGGQVVAAGTPSTIAAHPESITGAWLSGRATLPAPDRPRPGGPPMLLRGARGHNLQGLDVAFPTGALTVVTGVSGSGKSTLVMDTLAPRLQKALARGKQARDMGEGLAADGLELPPGLQRAVVVDHSPIGRSPRSSPATYTKLLDPLRQLYAQLPEAQVRGLTPSDFSYNRDGACPACTGRGAVLVEMHFLSDVWMPCEECGGRRYRERVLDVRWQGASIADVLAMPAQQALGIFANHRKIARVLRTLCEVGLGYLELGRPANTISGGEAQRVKLAQELAVRRKGTVYLLDEPTTGLHPADVVHLLGVLQRLVDRGDTVVLIEHAPELIRAADHVIDLGPEGGEGGGRVVATGTPAQVARVATSHTGRALEALWSMG